MPHQFHVQGMSCQHCVRSIEDALLDLDPQAQVTVDLASATVTVESDQGRDALHAAIVQAGYVITPENT